MTATSLVDLVPAARNAFDTERAALNAGLFVDGLLGDERRKTGWMRAEAAGDPGPGGSRRFWAVTGGMPMHCATWRAIMPPSILRTRTQCW